jgi:Protein of unknown function (DUF3302)
MPWRGTAAFCAVAACTPAQASMFSGETLDAVANGVAWVALIVAPIVGVVVFWLVHILPEKIAEQRRHPQAKAIQTLCLLSLFFGGLLWPLAWLWAYSKPVLYRMAYGTDLGDDHHGKDAPATTPPVAAPAGGKAVPVSAQLAALEAEAAQKARDEELVRLRAELAELRRQLGGPAEARAEG